MHPGLLFVYLGSKSSHATKHGDPPEPVPPEPAPSETTEPDPNLYTLRVYRSFPQTPGDKILALVSISLLHPVYFEVIVTMVFLTVIITI